MTPKSKMFLILILLIGTMYFWITKNPNKTGELLLSVFMLTICAYWLGRIHGEAINIGRFRAGDIGSERQQPSGSFPK